MHNAQLSTAPSARQVGLVMTRTDTEMMVFDTETNQLHHLNPLATAVWAQLDGTQTISAIASTVSESLGETVSDDAVTESIRLLSDAGLLKSTWIGSTTSNGSRRAFLRRAAVVGAASVPAIMSITAPAAAQNGSTSCPADCPGSGGSSQSACCKNSDDCKDLFPGPQGDWNCTGGGQVEGVPKGCCVYIG